MTTYGHIGRRASDGQYLAGASARVQKRLATGRPLKLGHDGPIPAFTDQWISDRLFRELGNLIVGTILATTRAGFPPELVGRAWTGKLR